MTVACDFCLKLAACHEDTVFLESPSGLAHICGDCVDLAAHTLSRKRLTDRRERATTVA